MTAVSGKIAVPLQTLPRLLYCVMGFLVLIVGWLLGFCVVFFFFPKQ